VRWWTLVEESAKEIVEVFPVTGVAGFRLTVGLFVDQGRVCEWRCTFGCQDVTWLPYSAADQRLPLEYYSQADRNRSMYS
jgi:hypothetical protein